MYFHCQTLYLKSSKMELVTFSLFFIHSIQPQRFPAVFLQSKMLCCMRGGIQVGCSSPLGFLSPRNGTPGDLGKDVTDKIYIFYLPRLLKHRPRCLDCSNLVPFSKVRKHKDTLKHIYCTHTNMLSLNTNTHTDKAQHL